MTPQPHSVSYLAGFFMLPWMTILYWVLFFPVTVPVMLVSGWLILRRRRVLAPVTARVNLWTPSLFLLVTYAWGAAFIEQGAGWPAWRSSGRIALITIVLSLLVAIRQWKRSAFTSRAAGILLMQLWFSIVGAWIVAASAYPNSGLGAL